MRLSTKIFTQKKEEFRQLTGTSKGLYAELIRGEYDRGAQMAYAVQLSKALNNKKNGTAVMDSSAICLWDFLWYYKRSFHAVLPWPIPDAAQISMSGIDTTILTKLDKDLSIDSSIDGVPVFVQLSKRNVPLYINGYRCDWTVYAYNTEGKQFGFHFATGERIRKVYMDGCKFAENKKCNLCGGLCEGKNRQTLYRRSLYRTDCKYDSAWLTPMAYLLLILYVADKYVNREKAVRNNKKDETVRSIMVAKQDPECDTERVLPLVDYVYEYRESKVSEYKGGHHASPVSHDRRGYYRKCRHGSYIRKDGEFVEVPKGTGNFTYVRATIVNAHKDTTRGDMI